MHVDCDQLFVVFVLLCSPRFIDQSIEKNQLPTIQILKSHGFGLGSVIFCFILQLCHLVSHQFLLILMFHFPIGVSCVPCVPRVPACFFGLYFLCFCIFHFFFYSQISPFLLHQFLLPFVFALLILCSDLIVQAHLLFLPCLPSECLVFWPSLFLLQVIISYHSICLCICSSTQ